MTVRSRIPTLLAEALAAPTVASSLGYFLDRSPETKHEGLVGTHISAYLRSQGVASRREVQRVDLVIDGVGIEAKYHYEGDLLKIECGLSSEDLPGSKKYPPVSDILKELGRLRSSFFLWHVCVRNRGKTDQYKYSGLIDSFYSDSRIRASSLSEAVAAAEYFINQTLHPLLQRRVPQLRAHTLPTIQASHSALLSRLYEASP